MVTKCRAATTPFDLLSDLRRSAIDGHSHMIDEVLGAAGSPIEGLFLAAMISRNWEPCFGSMTPRGMEAAGACFDAVGAESDGPWMRHALVPALVAAVRPTFRAPAESPRGLTLRPGVAILGSRARLIIEVGSSSVPRPKRLAKLDDLRDHAMRSMGWWVLRFTGKEVAQDARECAHIANLALFDFEEGTPNTAPPEEALRAKDA
jgi:hypothetical protein